MPDLFVAKKPQNEEKKEPEDGERHMSRSEERHALKIRQAERMKDESEKPASDAPRQRLGAFTAFCEYPENIAFENQEAHEVVYLFIRRALVTNVPWATLTILFAFLPIFFLLFILPVLEQTGIVITPPYLVVLALFYCLILFGYAFLNYVSWFYNIGIITNIRLVDIDLTDITNKNVAATEAVDVVDVEYNQKGFLEGFFDFGDIQIQTEGLKPNFEFLGVPKPGKVSDVISDLLREVRV